MRKQRPYQTSNIASCVWMTRDCHLRGTVYYWKLRLRRRIQRLRQRLRLRLRSLRRLRTPRASRICIVAGSGVSIAVSYSFARSRRLDFIPWHVYLRFLLHSHIPRIDWEEIHFIASSNEFKRMPAINPSRRSTSPQGMLNSKL